MLFAERVALGGNTQEVRIQLDVSHFLDLGVGDAGRKTMLIHGDAIWVVAFYGALGALDFVMRRSDEALR